MTYIVRPEQKAFTIDGGGGAIPTGAKAWIRVPYKCTITGWEITASPSGSIVIDVWAGAYGDFPLDVGNTVIDTGSGGVKPTISVNTKAQSVNVDHWTTAIDAGDYLRINVDSATDVTFVVLILKLDLKP